MLESAWTGLTFGARTECARCGRPQTLFAGNERERDELALAFFRDARHGETILTWRCAVCRGWNTVSIGFSAHEPHQTFPGVDRLRVR